MTIIYCSITVGTILQTTPRHTIVHQNLTTCIHLLTESNLKIRVEEAYGDDLWVVWPHNVAALLRKSGVDQTVIV